MTWPFAFTAGSAAGAALALATTLACGAAPASTVSLQDSLQDDEERVVLPFALGQADQASARTGPYGGGLHAAGQLVASGGFAPVLTLFLQGFGPPVVARGASQGCGADSFHADPASGYCREAGFSAWLQAGAHELVLWQHGNEAPGQSLAEGYQRSGEPDFTGWDDLGLSGRRFVKVDGAQRKGFWALDVNGAPIDVPEPASALLALVAGLALSTAGRMRRKPRTA